MQELRISEISYSDSELRIIRGLGFSVWSGNLFRGGGFQHGDVKDGVDTSHRVGEVEGEGDRADLGYNLKQA